MKKIIIDFDEVICDNEFLQAYNEFFNTNKKASDFPGFYIDKTIEDLETRKAFGEYLLKRNFYRGAVIKEGAADAIEKLSQKYDVYICSAYYMDYVRDGCGTVLQQKYEFIAKQMPKFNMQKAIFTSSKNVVVGDIMIDDNMNNLLTNKSYQKLMFTAEHNLKYSDDDLRAKNIVRVNNWQEVLDILLQEK